MNVSRNVWYIISSVVATLIWAGVLLLSVFWGWVKLVDLMGSNLAFVLLSGLVGSVTVTVGLIVNYLLNRPKVAPNSMELAPLSEGTTQADVEKQLQAVIEADPAIFNLSSNIYPDQIRIRARANRLNVLAARAKGILGSNLNMEESIVNADLVVQMPNADGYLKEIATRLLGKLREHQASTIQDNQMQSALDDQHLTELDVVWHLSRDVQPVPPYGSQDMLGSDRASTLHVTQRGKKITFTGKINHLKKSYQYQAELGPPYTAGRLIRDDNIGGSRASFSTDENGSGSWSFSVTVDELATYGIKRFSLWIGDVPKNATVLLSDNITIRT